MPTPERRLLTEGIERSGWQIGKWGRVVYTYGIGWVASHISDDG